MNGGNKTADNLTVRRYTLPQRYGMPIGIFALSVLSIVMLAWVYRISETGRANFALANALMDVQIKTATSHLWLEERITGDLDVNMDKVWRDLDDAIGLCDAILNGGETEHGLVLEPLRESRLRMPAEEMRRLLLELKRIALQRHHDPSGGGIGSLLDEHFDNVFDRFQEKAGALELFVEKSQLTAQDKSRRFLFGIFFLWLSIMVATTIGLWSRDLRRMRAETALRTTNVRLERQTEELRKHRENLMELVDERTVELTAANRNLRDEITERKHAEEAAHKSEERYRMLVETMNDGLVVMNDEGRLGYANDKFCEMLGFSRAELLGHPITDFVSEEDRNVAAEQAERRRRGEFNRYDLTFRDKDDRKIFTLVSPRPVFGEDLERPGSFAVITDLTEKIAFQATKMRAAHLASLGELAAGVAHEINNPVNGILNLAQILCNENGAESREHDLASRVVKEGRRIADIVRGLMAFARDGGKDKGAIQIRKILSDALGLTESSMRKEGIALQVAVPPDLPEIVVNHRQMQQVFVNVIVNARYALNQKYPGSHEDKILEILGEEVTIDGRPHVRVVFRDHGTGISPGIINKVMEPFFSTKPSGKGTGLGLSISHGVIDDHGGRLNIESVDGEFTKIVIDLPVKERESGTNPCDR